jgi:hypothetical protein
MLACTVPLSVRGLTSSGMKKTGERMSGIDLLPGPSLFSMQQVLIYKRLSSMQENTCGTEPVFFNVYGAQESIPRNEFRQPV